tara:strand:- start:150 stop:674 length:525 start_codon:yes stop_codon:yes gene_type:complete
VTDSFEQYTSHDHERDRIRRAQEILVSFWKGEFKPTYAEMKMAVESSIARAHEHVNPGDSVDSEVAFNIAAPLRALVPENAFNLAARYLEERHVHELDYAHSSPLYFVWSADGWFEVTGGNVFWWKAAKGWTLQYRIDYKDGSSESGVARPGEWAHCTADNHPSIIENMSEDGD